MQEEEKKEPTGNPVLGAKLSNFRRKLGLSIGIKKITQPAFGEMYGGYSGRAIASYELGDSEAPASLLYVIWEKGNSIDALFGEGPITEQGKKSATELYAKSVTARLKGMSAVERERVLKEVVDVKGSQNGTTKKDATTTSRKRKASDSASGKTKKR